MRDGDLWGEVKWGRMFLPQSRLSQRPTSRPDCLPGLSENRASTSTDEEGASCDGPKARTGRDGPLDRRKHSEELLSYLFNFYWNTARKTHTHGRGDDETSRQGRRRSPRTYVDTLGVTPGPRS